MPHLQTLRWYRFGLFLVLAAGLFTFTVARTARAASIVIDTTVDAPDTDTTDGECNTVDDDCSLRAAIQTANANPGADTTSFSTDFNTQQTIVIRTTLPTITESLNITGTAAKVVISGTNELDDGYWVTIDGLIIEGGSGYEFSNLVVNTFKRHQIIFNNASNIVVRDSYLGISGDGLQSIQSIDNDFR